MNIAHEATKCFSFCWSYFPSICEALQLFIRFFTLRATRVLCNLSFSDFPGFLLDYIQVSDTCHAWVILSPLRSYKSCESNIFERKIRQSIPTFTYLLDNLKKKIVFLTHCETPPLALHQHPHLWFENRSWVEKWVCTFRLFFSWDTSSLCRCLSDSIFASICLLGPSIGVPVRSTI